MDDACNATIMLASIHFLGFLVGTLQMKIGVTGDHLYSNSYIIYIYILLPYGSSYITYIHLYSSSYITSGEDMSGSHHPALTLIGISPPFFFYF